MNFAVGIVLARLLVPADFGAVATVGVLTGNCGISSPGAGTGEALAALHKEVSQVHFDVVFTLQLLGGCAIYLLFVVIAPYYR